MNVLVLVSQPVALRQSGYDIRVTHLCAQTTATLHLAIVPLVTEDITPNLDVTNIFASVTTLDPIAAGPGRWRRHLRRDNIHYLATAFPQEFARTVAALRDLVRRHHIERVVVFGDNLAEVAEMLDPTPRIVDICDSRLLTAQREMALDPSSPLSRAGLKQRIDLARIKRTERHVVLSNDAVVAIAEPDAATLRSLGQGRIVTVANGVDPAFELPLSDVGPSSRSVAFWGNLSFQPNVEALKFFIDRVYLPYLRPAGVHFCVVGPNAPGWLQAHAERDDGLELTGFVPDLRPVIQQHPIMVNPMISGSGLKNKVLEAFALGVSVVTTARGIEAVPQAVAGTHMLQADQPATFAASVIELLDDHVQRNEIRRAAHQLVMENYRWEKIGRRWNELFEPTPALPARYKESV